MGAPHSTVVKRAHRFLMAGFLCTTDQDPALLLQAEPVSRCRLRPSRACHP